MVQLKAEMFWGRRWWRVSEKQGENGKQWQIKYFNNNTATFSTKIKPTPHTLYRKNNG